LRSISFENILKLPSLLLLLLNSLFFSVIYYSLNSGLPIPGKRSLRIELPLISKFRLVVDGRSLPLILIKPYLSLPILEGLFIELLEISFDTYCFRFESRFNIKRPSYKFSISCLFISFTFFFNPLYPFYFALFSPLTFYNLVGEAGGS